MAKYFLAFKNEIMRNLGNRNDTDTQGMIISSFNDSLGMIGRATEWESLKATTTVNLLEGEYYLELDSLDMLDLRHIYTIKLFDGTRYYGPLSELTMTKWDQMYAPNILNTNSRPVAFTLYNYVLYFNAKAQQDYTVDIRFYYEPANITGDGSLVDLDKCDSLLNAMTTGMVFLKIEEEKMAQQWFSITKNLLSGFNIDIRGFVNFKAFSNSYKMSTGDYWSDPFVKGVR
jgi:hypothetical protein